MIFPQQDLHYNHYLHHNPLPSNFTTSNPTISSQIATGEEDKKAVLRG
jgi:hypothetical protein